MYYTFFVRHTRLVTAALMVTFFAISPSIFGQITNVNATPIPGVGHDYIGTLNDIVTPRMAL